MKKTSLFFAALAAAAVVAVPTVAANAEDYAEGWQQGSKGWWYQFADGSYAKDGWYTVQDNDEKAYMFDENGWMTTGWYYDYDEDWNGGSWYYSDNSGVLQKGWQKINGSWYYFDKWGYEMYAGWSRNIETAENEYTTYWFTPSGAMVEGWYDYNPASTYGDWVYTNSDGSAYDGWLKYNGSYYFFNNGNMYTSTSIYKYQKEDGSTYYATWRKDSTDKQVETYYVGRDGKMLTGWDYTEYEDATGSKSNQWRYADSNGVVKADWVKAANGSDWYFTNSNGTMLRDGIYYLGDFSSDYCDKISDNAPVAQKYDDYRDADGYIDWEKYDAANAKYQKENRAYRNAHTFIFDADGKMVTGWYGSKNTYGTTWYYANSDGSAYQGWLKSGGKYYYIDGGQMLTNAMTPDGYYVNADGVWQ